MKKTFIIIGIILILLIIGIWVYLLMFDAPKSTADVFTNFGLGGKDTPTFTPADTPSTVDTAPVTNSGAVQALRQLTTRPVAGAMFIDTRIRYIERGTGHSYDIDLATGKESLISGTTIPQTITALFSATGNHVIITSQKEEVEVTLVGEITNSGSGEESIDGVELPGGAREVSFATSSENVYYALKTESGSVGYFYDVLTKKSTEKFSLPLRDIEVLWGNPLYVYTTPSAKQIGYVYRVNGNTLEYVTNGANGLMAIPYNSGLLVTKKEDGVIISQNIGSPSYQTPGVLFPEKCVSLQNQTKKLYCATPQTDSTGSYPDDWYKGVQSFSDILWKIDVASTTATVLSDFLTESGREIDVSSIGVSQDGKYIYFINKNDDALWMFDTTITQ